MISIQTTATGIGTALAANCHLHCIFNNQMCLPSRSALLAQHQLMIKLTVCCWLLIIFWAKFIIVWARIVASILPPPPPPIPPQPDIFGVLFQASENGTKLNINKNLILTKSTTSHINQPSRRLRQNLTRLNVRDQTGPNDFSRLSFQFQLFQLNCRGQN